MSLNKMPLWRWSDLASAMNMPDRDQVRTETETECRGRIAIVGLVGVGKSMLYNRLRGWAVSPVGIASPMGQEDLGVFRLVDLSDDGPLPTGAFVAHDLGEEPVGGDLTIFVLDASAGVRPEEYAWLSTLLASGRPLLAVLNKMDLVASHTAEVQRAVENRIGMRVVPVSAARDADVATTLLHAMLRASPDIAVALGRDVPAVRQAAARSVIWRATLWSTLAGMAPIPMLDFAVQVGTQQRMLMRVGAMYGEMLGDARDVIGPLTGVMTVRLVTLAALKFIPVIGWIVSGVMSGVTTWGIGWGLVMHYEGRLDALAASAAAQAQRLHPSPHLTPPPRLEDWLVATLRQGWQRLMG
ncbi:MAG: hypothetical protein KIS91_03105 [Anaerolineae bacterium]|nr:hypothetical protein [Anaerolineae bacterium]